MIDLTEADVCNGLHVALGGLFVMVPAAHGWHPHPRLYGSLAGLGFGILKEFWFDIHYEDPDTSGGYQGGFVDLAGYLAGILAANLVLWL